MAYNDFKEKFERNPADTLVAAGREGMTFEQYVNAQAPEMISEHKRNALAQLWQDHGVFARSTRMSKASKPAEFFETPHREVLMYDYLQDRYNNPRIGKRADSITTGFEDAVGSLLYPGTGGTPRPDRQYEPPIDIEETLAMTMDISGTTYRPFRWDYGTGNDLERQPIAPGGPIPIVTLTQKEDSIQLQKWGNGFNLTYEALAEFSAGIDKLGNMISLEGLREQHRLLNQIAGKLVNGDGTAGSAARVVNQSTLHSGATNGQLSAQAWQAMRYEFLAPYFPTHALMRKTQAVQLELLMLDDKLPVSQLININAEGISPIQSMNRMGAIRYGRVDDDAIGADLICWLDARFSLEQVNMLGGDVQQQAQNIMNQTQQVVITNTLNFAKLDFDATMVMNVNA